MDTVVNLMLFLIEILPNWTNAGNLCGLKVSRSSNIYYHQTNDKYHFPVLVYTETCLWGIKDDRRQGIKLPVGYMTRHSKEIDKQKRLNIILIYHIMLWRSKNMP